MVVIYQIVSVVEILIAIAMTLGLILARMRKTPEGIRVHHFVMVLGISVHTIIAFTWMIPQFFRGFPSDFVFHSVLSTILLILALYQVIRGILDTRTLGKTWLRPETVRIHPRLGYLILILYYAAVIGGASLVL